MGGAERVAANISTYAPEGEFEFHYLVFEGFDNTYGAEIEARGGKIITIPAPHNGYRAYTKRLANLIAPALPDEKMAFSASRSVTR